MRDSAAAYSFRFKSCADYDTTSFSAVVDRNQRNLSKLWIKREIEIGVICEICGLNRIGYDDSLDCCVPHGIGVGLAFFDAKENRFA